MGTQRREASALNQERGCQSLRTSVCGGISQRGRERKNILLVAYTYGTVTEEG